MDGKERPGSTWDRQTRKGLEQSSWRGVAQALHGLWWELDRLHPNQVGSGRCERAHRQARGVEEEAAPRRSDCESALDCRYQKARRTHTRHPLLASSLGSMPATFGRTQRMQEGRQAGVSSISCLSCLTLRVAAGCRAAPCTGKRGQPPVLATFQPPVSGTSSGDTVAATAECRLAPAPTPKAHEPGDNDSRRSEATDVRLPLATLERRPTSAATGRNCLGK